VTLPREKRAETRSTTQKLAKQAAGVFSFSFELPRRTGRLTGQGADTHGERLRAFDPQS
jgi:hypothetical protein